MTIHEIPELVTWGKSIKLFFSPRKAHIIFTRKHLQIRIGNSLRIKGEIIRSSLKYFKLDWHLREANEELPHMENTSKTHRTKYK